MGQSLFRKTKVAQLTNKSSISMELEVYYMLTKVNNLLLSRVILIHSTL
jgi:hypothetical protein